MAWTDLEEGLNEQQLEAVRCPESVLVLSGAGTGKTRVIAARIARLLDQGVEPGQIAAMTFTNKAASEMRSRIERKSWDMFIGTFHSFGLRFLRSNLEAAGLAPGFQILDVGDQTAMVKRIMAEDAKLAALELDPREVRGSIDSWKNRGYKPDALPFPSDAAAEVFDIYERLLRAQNKVDFNDLILRMIESLEQDPELRGRTAANIGHLLVDELQDINAMQFRLLELLRTDATRVFGVGDDDQSIYGFRGALPRTMERFAKVFTADRIVRMERNYRSTKAILSFSNAVIAQNDRRLVKRLWTEGERGDLPDFERYKDEEVEAARVAHRISELIDSGVPPAQIGVLYRNHSLSTLAEESLAAKSVRFTTKGGPRFFARSEIRDVLAYLQTAVMPGNVEAVLRSVNQPRRGFGKKSAEDLEEALRAGASLGEYAARSNHSGLREYLRIIGSIQEKAAAGDLQGATIVAVRDSGLQAHFVERNEQERADHLDEVINAAARYQESGQEEGEGLEGFLARVTVDPDAGTEDDSGVALSTIHAAKGLEFEHVFLLGLEQDILPGRNAEDRDSLQEERRLLYVAATRARKGLHISCATRRRMFGQWRYTQVSQLLKDIDGSLFEGGVFTPRPGGGAGVRSPGRKPFPKPRKMPETKREINGLKMGQKVLSPKFGPGVILQFQDSGDNAKARVLFFKDRKPRWMLLAQAKLRPLQSGK